MGWQYVLFAFHGRINRKPFWIYSIALVLVYTAALLGLSFLLGFFIAAIAGDTADPTFGVLILVAALTIVLIVCSLAISIKRLHDRNKSGWWMLLYYGVGVLQAGVSESGRGGTMDDPTPLGIVLALANFAVVIWYLVEVGFLKGTQGPNRYGRDPLGGTEADAAF